MSKTSELADPLPRITASQAARLWKQLAAERRAGGILELESPAAAVELLQELPARRPAAKSGRDRSSGGA